MSSGFIPSECFVSGRKKSTLPLFVVSAEDYATWRDSAPSTVSSWLKASRFSGKAGACALLPGEESPSGAVVVVDDASCPWQYAALPRALPEGSYEAEPELAEEIATALALGWALGSYRFEYFRKKPQKRPTLVWPEAANKTKTLALADGICLARDLVNLPASHLGPKELADAARSLAKKHKAKYSVITGDDLLANNFPMIHAVGRASVNAPRLIDFSWGKPNHPKVTLVGKGVCFDTGGLDIKPPQYMKLMKKDMGGAALVLGLAHAIMAQGLPVRLRVLIPAVENSVSGNAMRPLDVLDSRKGITVEVGDTDAEGRLILADALTLADAESPDLIIDAATLTGAARVALGTALPAIFTTQDSTWREIEEASDECADPVWRLPLHHAYRGKIASKVADLCNISGDSYAGAIIAALFLNEFVSKDRDWVHMDTMGYNIDPRPGRPTGGEALGLLTLESLLQKRFAPPGNQSAETRATDTSSRNPKSTGASPEGRRKKEKKESARTSRKASVTKPAKKAARRSQS